MPGVGGFGGWGGGWGSRGWKPPESPSGTNWDYGRSQFGPKPEDSVVNPWQRNWQELYGKTTGEKPNSAEWKQALAQAMSLGNRDWEGDMRRFAEEDVNKQQSNQQKAFAATGMAELAANKDVQSDWAKSRQDALTRASMDAQGMKQSALETMRGMLGSATGVDLDMLTKALAAAAGGSGNYNEWMRMMLPYMEKWGASEGGNQTPWWMRGYARQSPTPGE